MNWEKIIDLLEEPLRQKLVDYISKYPELKDVIEKHFERLLAIGRNELTAFVNLYLQQTSPPPQITTAEAINYDKSLLLRWDVANVANRQSTEEQKAFVQALLLAVISNGIKEMTK